MTRELKPLAVGLLGPLSLRLHQAPVTVSAPKQRQVLALLALNAGQVVTVSALVEELWGDRPPRSYATTLQTYILQLRNSLAAARPADPGIRQLLGTRHYGYLLEAGSCQTDVEVFDQLARAGRAAADAGDHLLASKELDQALRLWRGPALVDVRRGPVLDIESASLEERRLGAFERRIESDLILGRHADLLSELTLAAGRSPMNENLCAFLMIALYRAGHVGRSLQAFHRLRFALNAELGVEPCARLQHLQALILSADPALDSWPLPVPRPRPRTQTPHQEATQGAARHADAC